MPRPRTLGPWGCRSSLWGPCLPQESSQLLSKRVRSRDFYPLLFFPLKSWTRERPSSRPVECHWSPQPCDGLGLCPLISPPPPRLEEQRLGLRALEQSWKGLTSGGGGSDGRVPCGIHVKEGRAVGWPDAGEPASERIGVQQMSSGTQVGADIDLGTHGWSLQSQM